jgi:large subunit ribosomal protein L5
MNPSRSIRIEKVTLNIGAGKEQAVLEKGIKLISMITGIQPVKTRTNKRIAAWGIRPGLPVGCKLTLRKQKAIEVIKRLLEAKENTLQDSNFDDRGNISFGVPEYIDVPNVKYDPKIGIMGFQASITLTRPGFRVKKRKIRKAKIGKKHLITKQEAIAFMKTKFNLRIGEPE